MEEYYPHQTPESPANFRDKLDTVFQALGWTTSHPIVGLNERKRVEIDGQSFVVIVM